MSAPVLADNLLDRLAALERRVATLERPPAATGAIPSGQTVPAGQVTAGAFGAGSYTFTGGELAVDSASATNVKSRGAGAGFEFTERDGEGAWVWYGNADKAYLWRSGYGDRLSVDVGGRITSGVAIFGQHPVHYTYAWFGQKDYSGATQYNFLTNGDEAIMSAPGAVYLSRNGSWVCRLDASGFTVNDDLAIPSDRALYLKGAWDAVHLIHHSSGLDGFVYRTWNEHQFWTRNMNVMSCTDAGVYAQVGWFRTRGDRGLYCEDQGRGIFFPGAHVHPYPYGAILDAYKFDHLGAWDQNPMWVRSDGGGSGARITFRAAGQNAAPQLKSWGQAFEARSWDDGGWCPLRGIIENYSSARAKDRIVRAKERLPRPARKEKLRALETVHFNRKGGEGCANCMGTGLAAENRRLWERRELKRAVKEHPHERHEVGPLEDDDELELEAGAPCPDCGGEGRAWLRPENRKNEEAGWFGFLSEEVEPNFPEAVFYRQDEDGEVRPSGLDALALIAILWEEVKELGGFEDEARPQLEAARAQAAKHEERVAQLEAALKEKGK